MLCWEVLKAEPSIHPAESRGARWDWRRGCPGRDMTHISEGECAPIPLALCADRNLYLCKRKNRLWHWWLLILLKLLLIYKVDFERKSFVDLLWSSTWHTLIHVHSVSSWWVSWTCFKQLHCFDGLNFAFRSSAIHLPILSITHCYLSDKAAYATTAHCSGVKAAQESPTLFFF